MGYLKPIMPKFYYVMAQGQALGLQFDQSSQPFNYLFQKNSCTTKITPSLNCKHPSMCVHTFHQPYGYTSYVMFMATNALELMMQFTTPLHLLHKMLISMWNKNNYMHFLQPHSTPFIDKSTLCLSNWHSLPSLCCHY
jgi:hypothetical protein